MRKKIIILALLLPACLMAQTIKPLHVTTWPESDDSSKFYVVKGERHGVSFFPKVQLPHVQYTPTPQLTFDKFHTVDVIYYHMERFAKQYPDLVELYEIAQSYEGRPILQMTINNKKTGKATDKPAAFFEANRHSGEVTSAESAMWLMQYLLDGYGKDTEITALVDRAAIYIRPVNNPDGHNLYMFTAQRNRSTVRPFDNDGDGLYDEDSPVDLDNDGMILTMRYKDDKGDYIIDPLDSSGRLMKRVEAGKGDYSVVSEGLDADGDGKIGEDGIGGLDLHRNYPENWRPMTEKTGRGWAQGGAGEYPLSEIETRSVVIFLLENPNIYVVNSMDTQVPMHLRPPSTSATNDRMYPEDIKWYLHFDALGKSITGYERAGDVYNDYGRGAPLFGHGPDFGYWYYGAIWYGDELWDGGKAAADYNNDGKIDDLDKLYWDDNENNGVGFKEWTAFKHPTLGDVEIGGWDPKFYSQNAPSAVVEKWAKNQAMFNFAMMKHLPQLEWGDYEVKKIKSYKGDSIDYRINVSYKNIGKLPTALKQADLVKIVKPDQLNVTFISDTTSVAYKVMDESLKQLRNRRSGILVG
ncbi:MAG: hypothetical protein LBN71_07510, partial [Tannerella sp.]|nr:hypothetical protein [Tannerella sp.]